MSAINDRRRGRWVELLVLPLLTLIANACVTYGVVSTQLQWIRADLDRQQRQIERIESRLLSQYKTADTRLVDLQLPAYKGRAP